jgi:tRNA-2-methylthio-N6-dimethylallyladenosine synthase
MNVSEAERMMSVLAERGYDSVDDMAAADLIILHTCCVRENAEKKIMGKIGELKRLKREKPDLIIGVTGCMAQKEGDNIFKKARHVDFVMGTNQVHEIGNIVDEVKASKGHIVWQSGDCDEIPNFMPSKRAVGFAAWIPIMYGCNNFCTYCIVPYVRGRERSRRADDIASEIRAAVAAGFKEFTLLGQNVNSYGKDTKEMTFAELLTELDKIEGVERIRYMTSHPRDMGDDVIDAIKNSRHVCTHFHLPVQYGSDRILKAMNRGYTVDYYRELVKKVRAAVPNASLTTDLIVGFPGETDEDFQKTLEFLKEIRYDAAYTFIYSKRSGTPAAEMAGQVPEDVKKARLQELMEVQNEISLAINKSLEGKVVEVMVEGESKTDENVLSGRTGTNKIVLWQRSGEEKAGDLLKVRITHAQTWVLKGELI